jgi:hypothetical protein
MSEDRMPWVSVAYRLPVPEWPTLIWGDKLYDDDFPLLAWLCHDGVWLLLPPTDNPADEADAAGYTRRMLGNVTHWLDWSPPEIIR